MSHIVVIGAGQAGSSLVAKLRKDGFDGDITLIGAETALPYQRPPLSKAYLLGEMEKERLFLRPESFYADNDITLKLGATVPGIDPAATTVSLGDEEITYAPLALTTGAAPPPLPPASAAWRRQGDVCPSGRAPVDFGADPVLGDAVHHADDGTAGL